jgi:predicted homoserine dehydrogenase-like protein
MFMAQARLYAGLHLVAVADLNVERARPVKAARWPDGMYSAGSLADAHKNEATLVTDNADAPIAILEY